MINLLPPTFIDASDAYPGLSPLHFHFWSPLVKSYATTAPFSPPPSCAITSPSRMSGELDGKNRGQALNSSLRQSFLPLAASRQEIIPRTPIVTTFASATVGELRGPE